MPQSVMIHHDWESARFHCPVCGTLIFEDDGSPVDAPCEHLLFSWISELAEFYNPAEEVRDLADDEGFHSPTDEEVLSRLPDTAVLFEFRSYEMSLGPVSLSIVHAINFSSSNDAGLYGPCREIGNSG